MITMDKLNERMAAERIQLEEFVKSQMELLEAMRKVQIYFASRNGGVTPKQAARLLLAEPATEPQHRPRGSEIVRDWPERIAAALANGPLRAKQLWDMMDTPQSKRGGFYQALSVGAKQGTLFRRTGGMGAPYELASGKPKRLPGQHRSGQSWEQRICGVLADGKALTLKEVREALKLKDNHTMRGRLSAAVQPLLKHGTIERDAAGRYTLLKPKQDQRRPAPAAAAKRVSRRNDRSQEFQWTPAILSLLADLKPRRLGEIWDELLALHKDAQLVRSRYNVAVPRMVRAGYLRRDQKGYHALAKGGGSNEGNAHNG